MNASSNPTNVAYSSVVGSIVAARRRELGVDQTALATALSMTQSSWSRIEQGISAFPVELLGFVAQLLGVTPTRILEDTEQRVQKLVAAGHTVVFERPKRQLGLSDVAIGAAGAAVAWGLIRALSSKGDGQ